MAGITGVVYIRTQWEVKSPKELGDKLREKGAARKEGEIARNRLPDISGRARARLHERQVQKRAYQRIRRDLDENRVGVG